MNPLFSVWGRRRVATVSWPDVQPPLRPSSTLVLADIFVVKVPSCFFFLFLISFVVVREEEMKSSMACEKMKIIKRYSCLLTSRNSFKSSSPCIAVSNMKTKGCEVRVSCIASPRVMCSRMRLCTEEEGVPLRHQLLPNEDLSEYQHWKCRWLPLQWCSMCYLRGKLTSLTSCYFENGLGGCCYWQSNELCF